MATNNLVYNSHGKKYAVPRVRVLSIFELGRGDRIAFHQMAGLYWHHAIVEYIDEEYNEINVIHYFNTARGFIKDNFSSPMRPAKARVVRDSYNFAEVDVYLMKHKRCLDPDTVVWNAISKIGHGNYNVITNNCEHFAMWCKTGKSSSDQVDKAEEMIVRNELKYGASKVGQGLMERGIREGANKAFTGTASRGGQWVVQRGVNVATNQALTRAGPEFVQRGVHMATNRAMARTACASQTSTAAGIGGLASVAGGAVIGGAIEGISTMYDIDCAREDMAAGRISRRELEEIAGKRYITGVANAGGAAAGMVIGQALIPVPILGGLLGATAGGIVGLLFGNTLANM